MTKQLFFPPFIEIIERIIFGNERCSQLVPLLRGTFKDWLTNNTCAANMVALFFAMKISSTMTGTGSTTVTVLCSSLRRILEDPDVLGKDHRLMMTILHLMSLHSWPQISAVMVWPISLLSRLTNCSCLKMILPVSWAAILLWLDNLTTILDFRLMMNPWPGLITWGLGVGTIQPSSDWVVPRHSDALLVETCNSSTLRRLNFWVSMSGKLLSCMKSTMRQLTWHRSTITSGLPIWRMTFLKALDPV